MNEKSSPSLERRDPLVIKLTDLGVPPDVLTEVESRLKDHLTGLPKDETCKAIVESLIQSGRRVTLEFDDLRYLKIFNKTIGTSATNDLLREIGAIYRQQEEAFRSDGVEIIVGRYAGDSFLIIIPDLPKEETEKILQRIHFTLKQIKKPAGASFKPHFDYGVVNSDELLPDERTYNKLIDLADRRTEQQKEELRVYMTKRARRKGNKPTRRLLQGVKRYG